MNESFTALQQMINDLTVRYSASSSEEVVDEKAQQRLQLQAQIEALRGVEDMESKAKLARLQAEYNTAQEDYNDTVNQHLLELSKNALTDLRDTMQEAFDDYWNDIALNFDDIKRLMLEGNQYNGQASEALKKLLGAYNIDSGSSMIPKAAGFASGTQRVGRNQLAWTQENGSEIIVRKSDGAVLTPLKAGDGVIPADMTERLFAIARGEIPAMSLNTGNYPTPASIGKNGITIEQNIESLLTVNGDVDREVLPDLKTILEKSAE
jgi:hypothetical protein